MGTYDEREASRPLMGALSWELNLSRKGVSYA